jgi:hypothetical protein
MEQSHGGAYGDERRSHANRNAVNQIALAEYTALRTESERRANIQWNVLALQTTSSGAVAGLAISTASDPALLLIIPLLSYMFGSRYILHDFHIKLIQQYVRTSLSGRLHDRLEWDRWKTAALSRSDQTSCSGDHVECRSPNSACVRRCRRTCPCGSGARQPLPVVE